MVTDFYKVTRDFPHEEHYGLTSQIRRSAVSIPSNITEGYGKNSKKDYIRFLQIANGSLLNYKPSWRLVPIWDLFQIMTLKN